MLSVRDLSRSFGSERAVDSVSFDLAEGEIVGFLGPNGAGKSTLLRMLCTFLEQSSGSIEVCGIDTREAPLEVRKRIGYLPEHNALFEAMRVRAFIDFIGRARGLRGAELSRRRDWTVAVMALEPVLGKRVQECSKGYRQRIGLAAALIHDPPLLLLDEPTHGLDPLQVVAFRDFLRAHRRGRAILFSSHILAEVARISSRLIVIQQGRLCLDAPVDALEAQAAKEGSSLEELVIQAVRSAQEGER